MRAHIHVERRNYILRLPLTTQSIVTYCYNVPLLAVREFLEEARVEQKVDESLHRLLCVDGKYTVIYTIVNCYAPSRLAFQFATGYTITMLFPFLPFMVAFLLPHVPKTAVGTC